MRTALQISCLVALSMSHPAIHPPANHEYINNMLDVVDSGLNSPAEGRALFVSVTLTSTTTQIDTSTVTSTMTPSCYAGTFTECTTETESASATESMSSDATSSMTETMSSDATSSMTDSMTSSSTTSATDSMTSATATTTDTATTSASATTTDTATSSASATTTDTSTTSASATTTDTATSSATATTTDTTTTAATRAVELERSERSFDIFENFPDAIVTASNGEAVDISAILPTKALAGRSDLEVNNYNVDGVILDTAANMQSGQISWQEMAVQGLSTCGRSNEQKRPRFIALQQEVVAKNLTKIETETVTATETVTFSVELQTCTQAGFTFAVEACGAK